MLEEAGFGHSEALHDGAGSSVVHGGKGNDLPEAQALKSDSERLFRRFRRQAFSPMFEGEAPSDFDARREGELRRGRVQADVADKLAALLQLGGPKAPPPLVDERFAAIGHGVALGAGEAGREELHHSLVVVEGGEGGAVGGFPLPQTKTFRFKFYKLGHIPKTFPNDCGA